MYATVRLCLLVSTAALCAAAPYYHVQPQQRQFFYPQAVPQYNPYAQFSQYVVPAPTAYRQVYYAPHTSNLVAPLRYTSPVKQQVLYYPGGAPYLLGDEQAEQSWGEWLTSWGNYVPALPAAFGGASEEKPAESETPAEASAQKEKPAKEGDKEKEDEEVKPNEEAKVKGAPQKYVLVGQPQFFGNYPGFGLQGFNPAAVIPSAGQGAVSSYGLQRVNPAAVIPTAGQGAVSTYGLQRVNPAAVIPSADHGAVSSYLLLKNFPGVKFAPQIPQVPQTSQVAADGADAEVVPGSAALDYQKLLQASRQQKEYSDENTDGLSVEAEPTKEDKVSEPQNDDAAASEGDEETGTNE